MIYSQEVLYTYLTKGFSNNQSDRFNKKHRIPLPSLCYFLNLLLLLVIFIVGGMIPSNAGASGLFVFGPESFARNSGSPIVVQRVFNPTNSLLPYTLKITNGGLEDGMTTTEYVSSSQIYLNGALIIGTSNFNQNVQSLSFPVILQASNTLTVELRGKPGGQLSIEISKDQNTPPTANSGADQTVFVGDTVQLAGNGSTDIDGDPITFLWQLIEAPTQSQTILNNETSINPSIYIDKAGRYTVDLVVNDGFEDSVADPVVIDTQNSAPVADAGTDQSGFVNSIITFDGSQSHDVDDDLLNYQWRLVDQPVDSQSVLQSANSILTGLTIDQPGHYIAELVVNDGTLDSTPDLVAIDTLNSAPVAVTGLEQNAFVGNEVILDGIGSFDADGDSLSYHWSILNKPAGSIAALLDAGLVQSRFFPDVAGLYVVQLIVQDLELSSEPKTTTVTVTVKPVNQYPVILSMPNTTGVTGEIYAYAVNAQDQDGDSLDYQLVASPVNMTIDSLGLLEWTPQTPGVYAIIIKVTDGQGGHIEQSFSVDITDPVDDGLPPDPVTVASPHNSTEFTSLIDSTAFLYSGNDPIQTGVSSGTIEASRVAIIRGKVENNSNLPLTGVTIKIKEHPEFGQTLSRADGAFDMVVNGGGLLTVNYTKEGYLPVQRKVQTPWKDFSRVETIIMIPLDERATVIDLVNSTADFQVAQGSISTDVDGSRQATVLFPQGTTATMTLPDGTMQALTSMTFRATEYTVGKNGPKRMPGPLPPYQWLYLCSRTECR